MPHTVDYNCIYNFDGNLTDDTGKTTMSVDSGTPSYVTGDNGQALAVDSAGLSISLPNEQFVDGRMWHLAINLRLNTGYTSGIILTIETGTLPILQLCANASNQLEWRSLHSNGINGYNNVVGTMTLDQWLCFGVNAWASTSYRELEPGTAGTNYNSYYNTFSGSFFGADTKVLIGQAGNSATNPNAQSTVATGIDIDFMAMDNYNENFFYSQPLDVGFDPREQGDFPSDLEKIANSSPIIGIADDPKRRPSDVQPVVALGGGGGGGGPVIKEFWS